MKSGIEFIISYLDSDALELAVRASNGHFAGETNLYEATSVLMELAKTLGGFPNHTQDRRTFELGSLDSQHAGGGIRLNFHCIDGLGHAGVDVELRNDAYKMRHAEECKFFMGVEATAIDNFVSQLNHMKIDLQSTAFLRGI